MTTGEAPPASFLPALFSNLTIAAAAVYTSGWVYLRAYYDFFDIDLSVMEFDFNETLLRSLSVVAFMARELWASLPLILLGCVIAVIVLYTWREEFGLLASRFSAPASRQGLLLVITVALSVYVLAMAKQAGHANAVAAWKAPRLPTELIFAKDCEPAQRLRIDNERGELLLLKSTPKFYFLFSRNSDPRLTGIMDIRLYRLPVACVSHMVTRTRRPYTVKGGP